MPSTTTLANRLVSGLCAAHRLHVPHQVTPPVLLLSPSLIAISLFVNFAINLTTQLKSATASEASLKFITLRRPHPLPAGYLTPPPPII
ncbi:unnamed protein product [Linum trigynum]|uniref:Uncharacterized protein n=1 Tax=Linum trigynum TaxID=586398 RepID=A0AAV2CRW4_9ROSI